jgi:hypothetical protein
MPKRLLDKMHPEDRAQWMQLNKAHRALKQVKRFINLTQKQPLTQKQAAEKARISRTIKRQEAALRTTTNYPYALLPAEGKSSRPHSQGEGRPLMRITSLMRNHVARNVASDHASRHMRKAGRKRWSDEDRAVCIAKYNALVTADERAEFEHRLAEASKVKA